MPRYAANLTMMWLDVEQPQAKFEAAAAAGFTAVERAFIDDLDVGSLKQWLDDFGLQLVLFDPFPGDWEAGDRGMLCIDGREEELLGTVRQAVERAHVLGTNLTNVLAGVVEPGANRGVAYDVARRNLHLVLDTVDLGDVTILLESVCDQIWKGSFLDTVELAAHMVREFDDPRVRLQFDAYQNSRAGIDPLKSLERHVDVTAHVQIADNPGRHQPGSGTLPISKFLERLDELGYVGHVGLEYIPTGNTEESLDEWLPREARA